MNKPEKTKNWILQISVNQIRESELKAKQKMYASSTSFGRQIVSKYTLQFADEF